MLINHGGYGFDPDPHVDQRSVRLRACELEDSSPDFGPNFVVFIFSFMFPF
ncbi:hypothetical protein HanRHA438_Chr14g0643371 [Helianthus annuus]|nr:hypothetical protein HanRHA438_Chr14g0643371 [Helianthus annuus]